MLFVVTALPGSYLAELRSKGGGSGVLTRMMPSPTFWDSDLLVLSNSDPELSGVGKLLGRGKLGIETSVDVSPIGGKRF